MTDTSIPEVESDYTVAVNTLRQLCDKQSHPEVALGAAVALLRLPGVNMRTKDVRESGRPRD